jgi:flagellin-specific chaperone FliS
MYLAVGKLESAMPLLVKQEIGLRSNLDKAENDPASDRLLVANRQSSLSKNLIRQNRHVEARDLLEKAIPIFEELKPEGWWLAYAKSMLAETLVKAAIKAQKQPENEIDVQTEQPSTSIQVLFEQAETLLLSTDEVLAKLATQDQTQATNYEDTKRRLRELYEAWGKPDEAAKWR